VLALVDLPVTPDQRASPWSYRTRHELRRQARSLLRDKLTRLGADDGSSVDGQDRGMAMTAGDSMGRSVASERELVIDTHSLGGKG
jgi:hypothetical protein